LPDFSHDQHNNAKARQLAEECMADGNCSAEKLAALMMLALQDGDVHHG
jgi:hypothetical protein